MDALARRVERRLIWRLIVPIAVITFVNSIDRVTVSFAGSAISRDLALSPDRFGLGVSMFFIAYLLFQYPHVRLLRAWGIKPWIAAAMVLWAISSVWMARVESAGEFYAARFLLGMAEAGFAPGMTWLISRWSPPAMRARMLAGALVAVPVSMVLGGPLCGWLLGQAGVADLPAWRSMYLLLAVPNLVLAAWAAWVMVDRPEQARWLADDERAWLTAQLSHQENDAAPAPSALALARDPWLWRCCATWLLVMTGSYALVFWLPQLVRQLDVASSELAIGTLSALPTLALAVGLLANGRHSDKTGERLRHTALPALMAGLAMLLAAQLPPGWPVLALLCVTGLGIGAAQGTFWAVPASVRLGGAQVPVGAIALISMFGTAGGVIGPWLTGALVGQGNGFGLAISVLALLLMLAAPVVGLRGRS